MNDKIVDLQSILEENNRLDSYSQGDSEEFESDIDTFRYRIRNIAYYTHLIGSDNIGDDNPDPLDLLG